MNSILSIWLYVVHILLKNMSGVKKMIFLKYCRELKLIRYCYKKLGRFWKLERYECVVVLIFVYVLLCGILYCIVWYIIWSRFTKLFLFFWEYSLNLYWITPKKYIPVRKLNRESFVNFSLLWETHTIDMIRQ